MKTAEFRQNLSKLSDQDLEKLLFGLRKELFGLTLNVATAHIKDYSQFAKLKRNIARVLTHMSQRAR